MGKNKTLGFVPELVPLVVSGQKYVTWRLWDDKNLLEGDKITLVDSSTRKPFATATIVSVVEKRMGNLTSQDKEGHEPFKSERQMYATYSGYYGKPVVPDTKVKIVHFKIIDKVF